MASAKILWPNSPRAMSLGDNCVHVWCLNLDAPRGSLDSLTGALSVAEQEHARRFQIEEKRRQYIVCRATLRQLLGEYLAISPSAIRFNTTSRGKPELAGALSRQAHFNVSHSGDLALIAVARDVPVGVDIERIRAMRYDLEISRRFFSTRENRGLESLPDAGREAAFFKLWTRKEAWLKATGDGIGDFLKRVEVSFLDGERARVLDVAGHPGEAEQWTLVDLRPAAGYSGALAVRRLGLNVQCWRWVER